MKLRKTPISERKSYTYEFDNGDKSIIEPGKTTFISSSGDVSVQFDESIKDDTIKELHLDDDALVRSNLKYINCEDNKTRNIRIENKKKWMIEHPNEPKELNPYNHPQRIIEIDFFGSDDEDFDKSRLQFEAAMSFKRDEELSEEIRVLCEFVATLPKIMQQTYELIFIKGYKQSEMCKKLGLSKSTVSERVKNLEKNIKENFVNRTFY